MIRRNCGRTADETGVDRNRRAALKLAGAGALWASGPGVASVRAGSSPGELHLSLWHETSGGARAITEGQYASFLNLGSEHLKLDDTRWLRVVDDQDQSVEVKAESDSGVRPGKQFEIEIYDGTGSIADDPVIDGDDGDVPVEVSGDTSMFETDPIFSAYRVELVEKGGVVTSTGDRIYGIGYPGDLGQDSATGEIEVTYPLVEEVQPSWAVVLEIVNYDEDGTIHEQVRTEFERGDGELVTTFDADEVDPVPEDGSRDYNVNFHVDGDPDSGKPNLRAGGTLELGEDAELTDTPGVTDAPTETDASDGTPTNADDVDEDEGTPGFGLTGGLASLGSAAYLLKRRGGGSERTK